jgi:hypothetical protein
MCHEQLWMNFLQNLNVILFSWPWETCTQDMNPPRQLNPGTTKRNMFAPTFYFMQNAMRVWFVSRVEAPAFHCVVHSTSKLYYVDAEESVLQTTNPSSWIWVPFDTVFNNSRFLNYCPLSGTSAWVPLKASCGSTPPIPMNVYYLPVFIWRTVLFPCSQSCPNL